MGTLSDHVDQKKKATPILRTEGITKVYPGTVALDQVNFNIYPGKVNVLIGENGAGKSTLMKILAGVEQPTAGSLILRDKVIRFQSPRDATRRGIGIIYQELNLFPNLNVSENIFMAREMLSTAGTIRHDAQEVKAKSLLERLEQSFDPKTLVCDLRIGQQQLVEIARALAQDVSILIMDEPTSSLSNSETDVLLSIVGELTAQGVSIVYISHKLDECLQVGDYFTILRDGRLIMEAAADEVTLPWIVKHMSGLSPESLFPRKDHAISEVLLQVDDLTLARTGGGYYLNQVSFSLHRGEILGLYGLVGAGRTELLESLFGLHPEAIGTIRLNGVEITGRLIDQRIAAGLALIPEDRQLMGLVQKMSVAKNMTLAALKQYVHGFAISGKKEKRVVDRLVRELSIKIVHTDQLISSLSGGNQQKVVIAKSLLTSPKVLLMDEPTRGIDVAAKADIFGIMIELAKRGVGVLFASSELKEVMAMADRVLVMANGRITASFERSELKEDVLMAASVVGYETIQSETNG